MPIATQATSDAPAGNSCAKAGADGGVCAIEPADLAPATVVERLNAIDWAFTSDETGFLAHNVHPYPAKFIPQLPYHLTLNLSRPGDLVLDPFGGSGTTALESLRLGRRSVCLDANPVGLLVGRAKTCRLMPVEISELRDFERRVLTMSDSPKDHVALLESHGDWIPAMPNRSKWFTDIACAELAYLRRGIEGLEHERSRVIGQLALSRIILRASNQDSETRYTAKPRDIDPGQVFGMYAKALAQVLSDVVGTAAAIRYGRADFIHADCRSIPRDRLAPESVDLVVTSPPYGNAMDYHLYHRFRMFWLGYDPKELARIEVGSHLRHQREKSGFASYRDEMKQCMAEMLQVMRPGAYAAFVIGDSIYEKQRHDGGDMIEAIGSDLGFDPIMRVQRELHSTKRSFTSAARRATSESIVVLRKPDHSQSLQLIPVEYNLWPYESDLSKRELARLRNSGVKVSETGQVHAQSCHRQLLRRLTFYRAIESDSGARDMTWQSILENGWGSQSHARKDPKYVTHGIHEYKGKFYPQLARSLLMLSGAEPGASVLDPFCGSGTTILEGHLNGMRSFGMDMNPLAAKVSKAKVGVLSIDSDLFDETVESITSTIRSAPRSPAGDLGDYSEEARDEIMSWFAEPVARKMTWLLRRIRAASEGVMRDFLEVLLSSLVRSVSNQEPSDLRIRRRKQPLEDANVFDLFVQTLEQQAQRVRAFWEVRGYAPFHFHDACIGLGDSRQWSDIDALGARAQTVDYVVSSPPYATALPYIDTDRLSILLLEGMPSKARRPIEQALVGSREIRPMKKRSLDEEIDAGLATADLPVNAIEFIRVVRERMVRGDVGFRRANMPALLLRYFDDMAGVLRNATRALRVGGHCYLVMGDNKTSDGESEIAIPTGELVASIAEHCGLTRTDTIPITVTTENRVHIRHAINENRVLCFDRRG